MDTVAGDDVINSIEHGQNLIVTGTSDGLAAGTALTVTINNIDYAATVRADGTWSAAVPSTDVSNWPAGTQTITVTGNNSSGTPVSISHDVTVDLSAVAIAINPLTTDDVLNAVERGSDLQLSGTTSNVEEGQNVTILFNGKTYNVAVAADGSWSTVIPAADLAGLKDGSNNVQASVTNLNGNSASANHAYTVDATAPSITINTLSGNDILNATEAGQPLTISGTTTAEAGQSVAIAFNGKNYTATVNADGSWTVDVPASDLIGLSSGVLPVTASVTDKAGNPASANHNLTVDTSIPVVTINTVAGDNVINLSEHAQPQVISGSATGAAAGDTVTVTIGSNSYNTVLDAAGNWSVGVPNAVEKGQDLTLSGTSANLTTGTVVTVTLNGKNYSATTDASGNWSLTVPVSDLTALGEANYTVTASATNSVGNTVNASANLQVDTNAVEKGQDLTLSGTSANLTTGTVVTVTLNGKNYSATTDASGNWTLTVPVSDLTALGEANYTVTASATNSVGNTVNASTNLQVDTARGQTISGSVTRAAVGDTVTVQVGGNTYTTTVQTGLVWSINVPASALQGLGNGPAGTVNIGVAGTSSAGNPVSISHTVTVDLAGVAISINAVTADDVINAAEKGGSLTLSGTTTNGARRRCGGTEGRQRQRAGDRH
ncbi:hypothetical protein GM30_12820 [Trabulsiella odontotermitis]|nr:hypothetical protein GM30_12820 [Trabulsiella odontotermitis]